MFTTPYNLEWDPMPQAVIWDMLKQRVADDAERIRRATNSRDRIMWRCFLNEALDACQIYLGELPFQQLRGIARQIVNGDQP